MNEIENTFRWSEKEGTYKVQDSGDVLLANFYPKVVGIQYIDDEKEVVIKLLFASGMESEIRIPIKKINRIDWFQLDNRCIVEDAKDAERSLKRLVCLQIANYENKVSQITQYTQLGWNTNAYGNAVYVFGNCCIGGGEKDIISLSLAEYKLQICYDDRDRMIQTFWNLFYNGPAEAKVSLLYFFTGLIKSLFREAGAPVDFVLYIFGEQQNRKTTLARLTNNLYNRDIDMDFALRTVIKTSSTTAEKLISTYKDATLILDDVYLTGNKADQQKQENIMESVVRMLGNRARKSSNAGNGVKEYFPNANVIITGEYLPRFSASTLSRMFIMEVKQPIDSGWLEEFGREPLMLSTVAYMFVSWIQVDYQKHVDFIRNCFEQHSAKRNEQVDGQGRISDHRFILLCTGCLLQNFFVEHQYDIEEYEVTSLIARELQKLMNKQEKLMRKMEPRRGINDYCRTFAELYKSKKLNIVEGDPSKLWKGIHDGFMPDKKNYLYSNGSSARKDAEALPRPLYNNTSDNKAIER